MTLKQLNENQLDELRRHPASAHMEERVIGMWSYSFEPMPQLHKILNALDGYHQEFLGDGWLEVQGRDFRCTVFFKDGWLI